MKYLLPLLLFVLACQPTEQTSQKVKQEQKEYALVIHGGAGTILKKNMTPEKEEAFKKSLNEAISIGEAILKEGGSAMDAVTKTINFMENDTLFNAGKGAVFTNEERNELDASIMDGKTLEAGAVGGVQTIKNPIDAAKAVMQQSPHVMLVGKGAETFAKEKGIEQVDPSYFLYQKKMGVFTVSQKR
jgi:Asparaginase